MNHDEAVRSFDIAKGHFDKGNFQDALRFFKISNRLEKSDIAENYMKKCDEKLAGGSSSHNNQQHHHGHGSHHRGHHEPAAEASQGASEPANYTPEQLQDVRNLLKKKDFYEILGVSKTSSDDEIKKSYRKLALKFHPDKNHAPKADEAFKKLAQAYDCLSNKEKKAYYDQTGSANPEEHYRQYTQHYHYDNFRPEDIFDMFFGMNGGNPFRQGGGRAHYYQAGGGNGHQHGQQGQQQQGRRGWLPILQFLPLILLFGTSYLFSSFGGESEALYSLTPGHRYPHRRSTRRLQMDYWVSPSFSSKHMSSYDVGRMEAEIEDHQIRQLASKCDVEKSNRQRLVKSAERYSGEERTRLLDKAKKMDMQACYDLNSVQEKLGRRYS